MRQRFTTLRTAAVVLAAALLLGSSPRAAQPGALGHLNGIGELKAWFNAARGHLRAIVLLSPT